jgi:hypothetical protein
MVGIGAFGDQGDIHGRMTTISENLG